MEIEASLSEAIWVRRESRTASECAINPPKEILKFDHFTLDATGNTDDLSYFATASCIVHHMHNDIDRSSNSWDNKGVSDILACQQRKCAQLGDSFAC